MNTSHEESTYALLVRSEERERSLLEMVVYAICILSVVAAIYQFAQQPVVGAGARIAGMHCLRDASSSGGNPDLIPA